MGEQKGESVVTENPKKVWKDSEGGPLKFAWKMKTRVEGESPKSSKVIRGDHFSEVTLKIKCDPRRKSRAD